MDHDTNIEVQFESELATLTALKRGLVYYIKEGSSTALHSNGL